MIGIIGLHTDSTFLYTLKVAQLKGMKFIPLNILAVVERGDWCIEVGGLECVFEIDDLKYRLNDLSGIYCRVGFSCPSDWSENFRSRWDNLICGLNSWLDSTPNLVVNRPGSSEINCSKSFHEQKLSSYGLNVPHSITSSRKIELIDFVRQYQNVICKSVSGARVDCTLVDENILMDYNFQQGALHLQQRIIGKDIRIHCIDGICHGVVVDSKNIDYRIDFLALRHGTPWQIPLSLSDLITRISHDFGLVFSGWDFKLDAQGKIWCLEVNPMPGYEGYDFLLEGAISSSLLRLLNAGR